MSELTPSLRRRIKTYFRRRIKTYLLSGTKLDDVLATAKDPLLIESARITKRYRDRFGHINGELIEQAVLDDTCRTAIRLVAENHPAARAVLELPPDHGDPLITQAQTILALTADYLAKAQATDEARRSLEEAFPR